MTSQGGRQGLLATGSRLREERQRQCLTLADVEATTGIPERHLAALEEDRFDLLPDGSYRRSSLREYADYLGFSRDAYADEGRQQVDAAERGTHQPGRVRARRLPRRLPLTVLAVVAAILLAVVVWQLGAFSGAPATRALRARIVHHVPRHPPLKPRRRAHHPKTSPHSSSRSRPSLTLTAARGACWLHVRIGSNTGRTIYEQTLQQGQTLRFGLRDKLWIQVGAPSNLNIRLGGRLVRSALSSRSALLAASSGLTPSP